MSKLIWKEWHEQSWKLWFGCLVLGAVALIGLRSRIVADETMMMSVCFIGLVLLPVLSSTGLVPAERAEGSFETFLAMPIPPWRILAAKTRMGLLLCAAPLVVAGVVSYLTVGQREMSAQSLVSLYMRTIVATLAIFVWMLALTIRLPNEARAGLLALGVLILWILVTVGLAAPSVPRFLLALSPIGFVFGFPTGYVDAPPLLLVAAVQLVMAILLWLWASRRMVDVSEERS